MSTNAVFNAVTSHVRRVLLLLRSIQFTTKAHVSITEGGIQFTAEDSRVMQGSVLIEKGLFSSYAFVQPNSPEQADPEEDLDASYDFEINLSAMLETLQILGISEAGVSNSGARDNSGISAAIARGGPANALSSRVLGTAAVCRLTLTAPGDPLQIVLEESNVTTTCSLTTYEAESGLDIDIPFQRDRLNMKIIMKASLMHSAIAELDSTAPTRLTLSASPKNHIFALSANGPHASASIEFSRDKQLLETFTCGGPCSNDYKFSMIKAASRAMSIASKASIRIDENGVLSLQLMVEGDGPGNMTFIDFRYAALLDDDEEDENDGGIDEQDTNKDSGIDRT